MSDDTTLRCYVCGSILPKTFALVSMSNNVDRVFVVHEDCVRKCDHIEVAMIVSKR